MAIKTWNATALTGGAVRALDAIPTTSLTDGDRAFVAVSGTLYYYEFDSSATNAESSPSYIRPDDYSTAGVWVLQRWFTQEDGYNPNLLINSDFAVNQEEYSSGVITTGEYGHDMWKSISSASYAVSDGALTMVSGTLGQSNLDLVGANGETVTMSVESGSVTIGATAGAVATTITSGSPYSWTLSMADLTTFITITAATAAKGIKIERGSAATNYQKPEPRAGRARCDYYYRYIQGTLGVGSIRSGIAYSKGTNAKYVSFDIPGGMRDIHSVSFTGLFFEAFDGSFSGIPMTFTAIVHQDHGGVVVQTAHTTNVGLINGFWRLSTTGYLELDARP